MKITRTSQTFGKRTLRNKRIFIFLFVFSIIFSANAQTLKERLERHEYVLASDSLQGRKAGTEFAKKACDYIVKQWKEIGVEPYFDNSFLQPFNSKKFQNVVGKIRGNDSVLKDEYIVVGAHYDHLGVINGKIYNGADDNASGVSTLIELARELKRNQSNLKRSVILIAFDAEEVGLLGSTYFTKYPQMPIKNIKLMISIDMVGWYKTSGKVIYEGGGTIKDGEKMILLSKLVPNGLNVEIKKFEESAFTATDTEPFATKGIPTLAVSTGLKSPYHKPEDEAHLIDYDGMALVTEHLGNLVQFISSDVNYESSGRVAKKHRPQQRLMFGLSANIGSSFHHYTDGALEGKNATSYGAGLMSQVNFGYFAIRPEVFYDRICAKFPDGTIATDNLTVPLSLVAQYLQSGAGFDAFIGGYYSYRFDGKQGKEKIDFTNTFYRNEGGLSCGFGVRMGLLKFTFTNRTALTNFTRQPNADNAHIRNRTNYFTLTYIF